MTEFGTANGWERQTAPCGNCHQTTAREPLCDNCLAKMRDMSKRTCDTCTYWGKLNPNNRQNWFNEDEDSSQSGERLRRCGCPKFEFGYGVQAKDVSDDGAVFEDDEGWAFNTGPRFGCIHWQGAA